METLIALIIVALVALAIIVWPKKANNNTPKNGGNYGGSVDQDPSQTEKQK